MAAAATTPGPRNRTTTMKVPLLVLVLHLTGSLCSKEVEDDDGTFVGGRWAAKPPKFTKVRTEKKLLPLDIVSDLA